MRKTENTLLRGWDGGCKIEDRAEKKNPVQGVRNIHFRVYLCAFCRGVQCAEKVPSNKKCVLYVMPSLKCPVKDSFKLVCIVHCAMHTYALGLAEIGQNSPKSQKRSRTVEFLCKI